MTKLKALMLSSLVSGLLAAPTLATAQQIAGEYQVEVRGTTTYLDRKPVQRPLRGNTSLTVEQDRDVITITFNSFASAMSTTKFRGRVGNGHFVALWAPGSTENQALMITGEVDGRRLRGRLVYPRATADAAVPGWTEVEFAAVRRERTGQSTGGTADRPASGLQVGGQPPRGAAAIRPGGALARPVAGNDDADGEEPFAVDVIASTYPEAPRTGRRITFLARATPKERGASVARMEVWVNGLVQGSSDGDVLRVDAGPFRAGRLDYDIVAVSVDGRRSELLAHTVDVIRAGNSSISGRVTGQVGAVSYIELLRRSDEKSLARTKPSGNNGLYSFSGIPAGDYVLFVNDGKREAMVSPSSSVNVHANGSSSYTQDFEVR